MNLSTKVKVWIGRLLKKVTERNGGCAAGQSEMTVEASRIFKEYSGTFGLSTERIHVPPQQIAVAELPTELFKNSVGEEVEIVASIEDQFMSVLALGKSGVYLVFLDGDDGWSVELYSNSFEEALDRLNVS